MTGELPATGEAGTVPVIRAAGTAPTVHDTEVAPTATGTGKLPAATYTWLSQPPLHRLWAAVRTRLEANGLQATGAVRLTNLTPQEREALSLLLSRQVSRPTTTIHLAALDTRLRISAAAMGLAETLTQLGQPLTDRRATRDTARARRTHLWSNATEALAASPLGAHPWAERWWGEIRRTGAVTRQAEPTASATLHQAIHTLTLLFPPVPPTSPSVRGRGDLATQVTGSAHGLDDGTLLSRLVLRGIAHAHGADFPSDAGGRRALWRLASVIPDEVSSTVLTYGLRPTATTWREAALRDRADHHAETHLTLRELRTLRLTMPPRTRIHICENPRVVEAAADAGCAQPLVCTSGSAATVVLTLLDALAESGCTLAYHGDFDWPGIALANRVIGRYDARPWRMSTLEYERLAARTQTAGTPPLLLTGPPVAADWDAELGPAMEALSLALHEEAALDTLLEDLA
ncbi:TIGR02679 family protein [Streptomyces sp. NBC_00237]|uniref:TIGR02679 family protein n=1 Tax=Streptomyces sp. NBC_00237 TaxID=2975687 RepID=UPI0022522DF5|nr:TIGR02679 family protein [Streptomyces sp. NBC_00237]MCX5203126.1 TIGR02679 family protein [Streptomyces sp. NBC_00237]